MRLQSMGANGHSSWGINCLRVKCSRPLKEARFSFCSLTGVVTKSLAFRNYCCRQSCWWEPIQAAMKMKSPQPRLMRSLRKDLVTRLKPRLRKAITSSMKPSTRFLKMSLRKLPLAVQLGAVAERAQLLCKQTGLIRAMQMLRSMVSGM